MIEITNEQYQAAIPECCRFQTAREHHDYLFWRWGLCAAIEDNVPMKCGECEFATRKIEAMEKQP